MFTHFSPLALNPLAYFEVGQSATHLPFFRNESFEIMKNNMHFEKYKTHKRRTSADYPQLNPCMTGTQLKE